MNFEDKKMKFEDIPSVSQKSIRLKCFVQEANLKNQPIKSIKIDNNHNNSLEIYLENQVINGRAYSDRDFINFVNELSNYSYLAEITNIAPDNSSFEIRAVFFNGSILEMGDFEIGVDDYTDESYKNTYKNNYGIKEICKDLENRSLYKHGDDFYFFVIAGPSVEDYINEQTEDSFKILPESNIREDVEQIDSEWDDIDNSAENTKSNNLFENSFKNNSNSNQTASFCVCGNGLRFVANPKLTVNDDTIYIATKLSKPKNRPERNIRLVRGRLKFTDWKITGKVSFYAEAQLKNILETNSSYLKKWDEYGDKEGNLLLEKARALKTLEFSNVKQEKDGCSVIINNITDSSEWDYTLEKLKTNELDSFDLIYEEPIYITNDEMTFKDFVGWLKSEEATKRTKSKTFKFKRFEISKHKLFLEEENIPVSAGKLCWSILGDSAQIKRRELARELILKSKSVNPQLGLIIEEDGEIIETKCLKKITPPLTEFVKNKVFKNPPTEKQIEAIDIALNTPDIAMIQGPPGTGKTTVIAAILERLNELKDKNESIKGQVLLSGFQHDAVENMANRVSINGLPVFKYGKRSNKLENEDNSLDYYENELKRWCLYLAEKIRKKNPQVENVELEDNLRILENHYRKNPSKEAGKKVLEKIIELPPYILNNNLLIKAEKELKKLDRQDILNQIEDDERLNSINVIRNLRTLPESFADDGNLRASLLLDIINDLLTEEEKLLLQKASEWFDSSTPPFLNDLKALQKKLLTYCKERPFFSLEKHNKNILELSEEAIKAIKERGYSNKNKKEVALTEFLYELENNVYGMMEAISEYSYAFAATCQQSASQGMMEQKGLDKKDNNAFTYVSYDYVIVDEAARVSPRDLLIPMVQGKKIILVGDHRQLPHIINEEIAREMEEETEDKNREDKNREKDWLKISMFQYLFSNRLKKLEQKDGKKRTVTLDMQYRMNPILGDFVSKNFYECFDKSEKFGSGLPKEHFNHYLPETNNKPACWIDLPEILGEYKRSGTSYIREIEAKVIINYLIKWLDSQEGKNLTFGVISFYKKQADIIEDEFRKKVKYEDYIKRVRIGTVDSFQGMEFDVVFLSMVRTEKNNRKTYKNKEIEARIKFGHLCLINRLNVAMSRQKKLLILVGDSNLTRSQLADEYIPGIVKFYRLCQDEGVVINSYGRS